MKVISILTGEGLLSDERAQGLMSWNHNSGFSVDDSVRFEPEDRKSMERVARYILRPPLSLERLTYAEGDDGLTDAERRARRRAWARLIRRVYEVDPLICTNCGGEMRIVSVILEHRVIAKIIGNLARKGIEPGRGPPEGSRYPLPKTA